jgi:hypothetical protein
VEVAEEVAGFDQKPVAFLRRPTSIHKHVKQQNQQKDVGI